MNENYGTITLIGSGEFGDSMARVYRHVFGRIQGEICPVFLDTPAGFELNSDDISARAADYFSQRFDLTLRIASFKNRQRASAIDTEAALRELLRANVVVAGPGSPSYAVRHWSGTPIWDAVLDRFRQGAHLFFASAAAISLSNAALPVYEIFKAGGDPHWLSGLNLFGELGLGLAIFPHWNNAEGGAFDTRFCFMGAGRLDELETQLPSETVILGIDEQTACVFDVPANGCRVMGAGAVTIRVGGTESVFVAGSSFGFERLAPSTGLTGAPRGKSDEGSPALQETGLTPPPSDDTTRYLVHLAQALTEATSPETRQSLIDQAHDTMHDLAAEGSVTEHPSLQPIAPYVEALIEVRRELRAAKQFDLADLIRERLSSLEIVLEDGATGTSWRRADP